MALDCPRCNGINLEEIEVAEVALDRCVQCSGLWFDNDEIMELLGDREDLRTFEITIPEQSDEEESAACPRCKTVKLRRLKLEDGDRTVLRCASCGGTWMDRGELRKTEDAGILAALKSYYE